MRALMQRVGLQRVADELIRRAGPTVRILIEPIDDEDLPPGASKLGGLPDLPANMDWPAWHVPMAFVGQLNLAEVAQAHDTGLLPRQGLLMFFFETDGEPLYAARLENPRLPPRDIAGRYDRRAWHVLHVPTDVSNLVRRPLPAGVHPRTHYQACAARFAAEVTLPYPDDPSLQDVRLTREEQSAVYELLFDPMRPLNRGIFDDGGHHLLGYPYLLGGDHPQIFAACCADAERGQARRWEDATQMSDLRQEAMRRWQLLLQVDSSEDTHMDWAGGGLIHWSIEREALRGADFSNVWLDMQFL